MQNLDSAKPSTLNTELKLYRFIFHRDDDITWVNNEQRCAKCARKVVEGDPRKK